MHHPSWSQHSLLYLQEAIALLLPPVNPWQIWMTGWYWMGFNHASIGVTKIAWGVPTMVIFASVRLLLTRWNTWTRPTLAWGLRLDQWEACEVTILPKDLLKHDVQVLLLLGKQQDLTTWPLYANALIQLYSTSRICQACSKTMIWWEMAASVSSSASCYQHLL